MPITDPFPNSSSGLGSPVTNGEAITPNDSTDLTTCPRWIYVGTAGDLKVDLRDGGVGLVLPNCAVGYHPLRAKRVYSAGTTATGLFGLW